MKLPCTGCLRYGDLRRGQRPVALVAASWTKAHDEIDALVDIFDV
ncbi:hypothetical protein [Streptomyces sp. NPDC020597]